MASKETEIYTGMKKAITDCFAGAKKICIQVGDQLEDTMPPLALVRVKKEDGALRVYIRSRYTR